MPDSFSLEGRLAVCFKLIKPARAGQLKNKWNHAAWDVPHKVGNRLNTRNQQRARDTAQRQRHRSVLADSNSADSPEEGNRQAGRHQNET